MVVIIGIIISRETSLIIKEKRRVHAAYTILRRKPDEEQKTTQTENDKLTKISYIPTEMTMTRFKSLSLE